MTGLKHSAGLTGSFLLTRLLRGVTSLTSCIFRRPLRFLLTRLLRGVTFACQFQHILLSRISTHTPLARRDVKKRHGFKLRKISTHTPLARRDTINANEQNNEHTFLLTRLLRGVTEYDFEKIAKLWISTHTPLARRDYHRTKSSDRRIYFYSHASCEA